MSLLVLCEKLRWQAIHIWYADCLGKYLSIDIMIQCFLVTLLKTWHENKHWYPHFERVDRIVGLVILKVNFYISRQAEKQKRYTKSISCGCGMVSRRRERKAT